MLRMSNCCQVDLECAENDKSAVEEELARAEKSVRDLELDLASVCKEKEMAETRVGHLEKDVVEAEVIAKELDLARKKVAGMQGTIDEITDANVELQRQCQGWLLPLYHTVYLCISDDSLIKILLINWNFG